jgi:ATP-dependent RNA helicase DDX46/PRP5
LIRPIAAPSSASAASAHSGSQLNRAALSGLGLKGLPVKPEFIKNSRAVSMDDSVETKRKLEKLGDMPAVDMSMADGEAAVGDLEVDDDDEEANRMDQALKSKSINAMDVDEDEEIDPLDAFMSGVKEEVKKVNEEDMMKMGDSVAKRSRIRLDEQVTETTAEDLADQIVPDELDATDLNPEDILALAAKKAKKKDLAVVDHTRIRYETFRKEFYVPPPDVAAMTEEEVELLRLELDGIKIRGVECPKPITKWSHYGLPANWCVLIVSSLCRSDDMQNSLDVIKRLNYTAPTSIQAQAIPAIMSGRDIIGVAKTGSGKTIAFLLPMFRHIKDQRPLEQMEGPIAIVMTPTRELAVQIHRDCKPFLKVMNLRVRLCLSGCYMSPDPSPDPSLRPYALTGDHQSRIKLPS